MPIVISKGDESSEFLVRRFKRLCEKDGLLSQIRNREFHKKPSVLKKEAKQTALKRQMKLLSRKSDAFLSRKRMKSKRIKKI